MEPPSAGSVDRQSPAAGVNIRLISFAIARLREDKEPYDLATAIDEQNGNNKNKDKYAKVRPSNKLNKCPKNPGV